MVYYSPQAHYRLAASIDLSGINWGTGDPLCLRDVRWQSSDNLTFDDIGVGCLGLFGRIGWLRSEDLGVVDVNVTGSGEYIGGLVGYY